jgi:Flp pilus assembly pilin Flp
MTPRCSESPVSLPRRLLRSEKGTAAVELAAGLLAFILAILGVIEFGRLMWAQNALNYSVQQGARCMLVSASCDGALTASTISGFTFPTSAFTTSTPSCGHQVSASYSYTFMTNLVTYPVTLTAVACM